MIDKVAKNFLDFNEEKNNLFESKIILVNEDNEDFGVLNDFDDVNDFVDYNLIDTSNKDINNHPKILRTFETSFELFQK